MMTSATPGPGPADDHPHQSPPAAVATNVRENRERRRNTMARLLRMGRVGLLILLVAAVFYWLRLRPLQVRAHIIQTGDVAAEVMGTGTLEARIKTVVGPKISGRVAKILVDQGDQVTEGQLLLTLDDNELGQQVEIATASVEVSRAALDRLNADKDRAVAVHHQAEFDFNRTQELYKNDTAASVELEKATEALSIAQAELARAEAAIVEGQKDLIAAEKTLAYHRARLADAKVNAPFDGLIVRRHRDPGDVVVPGSPVLTLISTDELWISAWVDETEMARLRAGQAARVYFRSEALRSYPGMVARLGREVDRETREFIVDVGVLTLPLNWAVGQRAEVYIETARVAGVVLLPGEFVVRRDGDVGVFILEDNRAAWRRIEPGLAGGEAIEVLAGLQPGDTIVASVSSNATLRNGQRIKITP